MKPRIKLKPRLRVVPTIRLPCGKNNAIDIAQGLLSNTERGDVVGFVFLAKMTDESYTWGRANLTTEECVVYSSKLWATFIDQL